MHGGIAGEGPSPLRKNIPRPWRRAERSIGPPVIGDKDFPQEIVTFLEHDCSRHAISSIGGVPPFDNGEYYFRFDSTVAAHITCDMLDVTSQIRSDEVAALPAAERLVHLRCALDGSIVFTHGFGIEGQLIFHWICERGLDIDVMTLDTGRLFPETYQLWAETERRYGRRIRAIYPNRAALERLVAKQGIDGIYESKRAREACCNVRKNRPLDRALAGAAAWITGLRADQNENRRDAGLSGFDASRGLLKFNPLYNWTREAVLAEARRHDVPINALHAKGFASIGCAPCTRALRPGEPERNGRWWWEQDGNTECGLHLPRNRVLQDNLRRDRIEIGAGCG
jgi:phosphoadenosine phosphosulfate reductase